MSRGWRRACVVALASGSVACGGRSGLLVVTEETFTDAALADGGLDSGSHFEPVDASVDAPFDVSFGDDSSLGFDASDDAPPFTGDAGTCEEGQNTQFPPAECSGTTDLWLAGPYIPAMDITVTRMEIHTTVGNLALLSDVGGAPGAVLFHGSVGPSAEPAWLGATVSPPVVLHAGTQYWTAEQAAYCSQTNAGPEDTEYGSPSLDGPWMITGTDNWTARFYGSCP